MIQYGTKDVTLNFTLLKNMIKTALLFVGLAVLAISISAADVPAQGFEVDFTDATKAVQKLQFNPKQWKIADGEIRSVNAIKQMMAFQFGTADWHSGEIKFAMKRLAVAPGDQHFGLLFGEGEKQFRLLCRGESLLVTDDKTTLLMGKLPRPLPVGAEVPWCNFRILVEGRMMRLWMDDKFIGEQMLPVSLSGPIRLYAYQLDIAVKFLQLTYSEVQCNQLIFRFDNPDYLSGWNKTSALTMEPTADCLKLHGNGLDAKIYRKINLPAGYYLISACGRGRRLNVQLTRNWTPQGSAFFLNLSRENDQWRTDWRPLTLKADTSLFLVVGVSANKPVSSEIKYIKIEQVQEPVEPNLPTMDELKKQRPEPEIVRGANLHNAKEIATFREWGGNVVRSGLGRDFRPSRYDQDGLAVYDPGWEKQLDELITWLEAARKAKVKCVIVLGSHHFAKGSDAELWNNPRLPDAVARVWQGIARKLLPYRDVIYGYDLCNEPLDWSQMPNPPRQWREAAKAAIKAIRCVDQETWIIYEPGPGGMHWGFAGMKPLPDTRIIYSLHFYSPHEFTHQGVNNIKGTDLKEAMARINVRYPGNVNGFLWNKESIKESLETVREFQQKYQVPIFVGEFSVIRWARKADAVQYLSDLIDIFEEYHWSWAYHNFRGNACWSVEHDETLGTIHDEPPQVNYETERAKVLKAGLARNRTAGIERTQ